MRTHAQAVVIGGGLVGCSILYHLAKRGWRDVVLLERSELTSGSTWHAAANIHGLHDSTNISRLQYYTMNLYKELEAETGQGCGVFQPGSLYLAQTEAREHQRFSSQRLEGIASGGRGSREITEVASRSAIRRSAQTLEKSGLKAPLVSSGTTPCCSL